MVVIPKALDTQGLLQLQSYRNSQPSRYIVGALPCKLSLESLPMRFDEQDLSTRKDVNKEGCAGEAWDGPAHLASTVVAHHRYSVPLLLIRADAQLD